MQSTISKKISKKNIIPLSINIIFLIILLTACSKQKNFHYKKSVSIQSQKYKNIVIIIPSYNNEQWCTKNLISVFKQKYPNFRVIYIDDCSSDQTKQRVKEILKTYDNLNQVKLICNNTRKGSLANIYHAVHSCTDDEIIVQLDGDDWFAHDQVVKKINQLYCSCDILTTWGSFRNWPSKTRGFCRKLKTKYKIHRKIRLQPVFPAGSIRTFYAWIFKKINKMDLVDKDYNFYQTAGDVAYMLPIIEMAGSRTRYIPEILCIRNNQTPINDHKVNREKQQQITQEISEKKSYPKLPMKLS